MGQETVMPNRGRIQPGKSLMRYAGFIIPTNDVIMALTASFHISVMSIDVDLLIHVHMHMHMHYPRLAV